MTLDAWKAIVEQKAKRQQERKNIEMVFNAEIVRRHSLGESKEEIVSSMGISRELFNRVMRSDRSLRN
jgi:hypothetical protein